MTKDFRMLKWCAGLAALLALYGFPAMAQTNMAGFAIAACGTAPTGFGPSGASPYVAGHWYPIAVDINGNVCVNASVTSTPTYYPNITPYTSPVTVTSATAPATLVASSTTARGAITVSVEGSNAMRCGQSSSVVFAGGSGTASGVLIGGTGNPTSWTWVSYIGAVYCVTSSSSSAAGVSATQ